MPRRRLILAGVAALGAVALGLAEIRRPLSALWTPPLPTTSWDLLARAKVELKEEQGMVRPVSAIPAEVAALDGRTVKLVGFMFPIEAETKTRRFLLVELPADCPFCFANWSEPSRMAEIWTDEAVDHVQHQVAFQGRLELMADDPSGILYRLIEAQPAG
jgi:hypothetical protein